MLRVYHAGGDRAHRARERALLEAGVDVVLVVPETWPGDDQVIDDVPARRLPVRRAGDVNRHSYRHPAQLGDLVQQVQPDIVDVHEEPVSLAARQWLRAAGNLPVVMYTAQNLDKRWPPPFAQYERAALHRTAGFYPCSRQAASVLRGKGYGGPLQVLPLGLDPAVHRQGAQDLPADEVVLGLVGRLVPEKGVLDAVRVLAAVHKSRPARLLVVGEGPEAAPARALSNHLGVADRCTWLPWCALDQLAAAYRTMHVVLVPSRSTTRWVEQFGRVITEGQANGAVPVAYSSGSIPEVVGDTGVVVVEGDVQGLSGAAVRLLSDPVRWRTLRARGLEATQRLSWRSLAEDQAEFYGTAVRGARRPLAHASHASREGAAAEFGPPARGPAGARPFAVPLLRERGPAQRVLGTAVDLWTSQR